MLLLHSVMIVAPIMLFISHTIFQFETFGFCIFKSCTGIECPACGITRSVMATFSGHITDAFNLHPAGPVILLLLIIISAYLSLVLLTKHKGLEWKKEAKAYNTIEWLMVGALLTGWIGKLLTQ